MGHDIITPETHGTGDDEQSHSSSLSTDDEKVQYQIRSDERTDSGSALASSKAPNPKGPVEASFGKLCKDNDNNDDDDDFNFRHILQQGYFEKWDRGQPAKKTGIVYKHLNVNAVAIAATPVRTLPSAILGTFGPDLYRILCRFLPFLAIRRGTTKRTLIHDFTGAVRHGQMLLVLGRPGAGCTTFLKALARSGNGNGDLDVTGDINYGGLSTEEQKATYRGEVNYVPEDDNHLPDINVAQTLTFALSNKTKKRDRATLLATTNMLTRELAISNTLDTKVGNAMVPGVSGGERKRVSIAEAIATKCSVLCLDNSTRGLDASTALNYVKSLRTLTDVNQKCTILALYQAGEEIYQQMDQVIVMYEGRCIFQGPASEAKQYFLDLGFYCPFSQTTADFLTACTDPTERSFQEGYAHRTPRSPEELEAAFRSSDFYQRLLHEVTLYEKELTTGDHPIAEGFPESVQQAKSHRTVSKTSAYTVSFAQQVRMCLKREYWLFSGDTEGLYTKAYIIIAIGLVVGSLFYGESLNSSGAFSRGGALFMSVLFLCWLQLAELMKVVTGLQVIARHQEYALYKPSAVIIARVILDLAVLLPQSLLFAIIMYFMCNLDINASKFWVYSLLIYTTMMTVTSLYRMFASLSASIHDAIRFSGIALNILIIYGGYVIPRPQLMGNAIWFGWLNYLNPLAYAFEAVATNEFANRDIVCDPSQLVPQQVQGAPLVETAHQVCSLIGNPVDAVTVPGAAYLSINYGFERSHLWRNFGILIAFSMLYILVTAFAAETFNFAKKGAGVPVFVHQHRSKKDAHLKGLSQSDIEHGGTVDVGEVATEGKKRSSQCDDKGTIQISHSDKVLTWENVTYSVSTPNGPKQLLNHVDGYCKPGVMIALMGVSGAGKTTLLNTLFQRHAGGMVSGEMLVDGKPPTNTFHRSVGFCEQIDLHDDTSTIREALEFSVLLRQDRSILREEKIAYIDNIIDLLELDDVQDTLLSSLSLELRKRLAIGVELAAKPSLALFLDEPTSGLDSQSATSLVKIIRKVCSAGQAVFCTIHQPSALLMQQFDMILALNPGGNVFYFGQVGENGQDVVKYFAERGCELPPQKNVAEFLLDTAASGKKPDGSRFDWNEEWKNSENAKAVKREIAHIKATRSQVPEVWNITQHEFAASVSTQCVQVTKRLFRQYWRDPSYLYGKLFTAVVMGIFNGFTYWRLGHSVYGMQNRMFSVFMIITIPAIIVNGVIPKFFQNMMLWMAREYPSRVYGWVAFTTAQILGEIPAAIVSGILYWLLWYLPVFGNMDHNTSAPTAGYVFLITILFWLFMASWGQWIVAFAPSFTVIANALPLFFIMVSLFNGVLRSYDSLPAFWRYTMYQVNPSQYWINGILAAVLPGVPVYCTDTEFIKFTPPSNLTCGQYAAAYASITGGNLTNPSSTDICNYCPLSSGDQYLDMLNVRPADKWRNLGIFCIFVVSNYALVYFFIWTRRIKHWSFGMGYLSWFLGKIAQVTLSFVRMTFSKLVPRRK